MLSNDLVLALSRESSDNFSKRFMTVRRCFLDHSPPALPFKGGQRKECHANQLPIELHEAVSNRIPQIPSSPSPDKRAAEPKGRRARCPASQPWQQVTCPLAPPSPSFSAVDKLVWANYAHPCLLPACLGVHTCPGVPAAAHAGGGNSTASGSRKLSALFRGAVGVTGIPSMNDSL